MNNDTQNMIAILERQASTLAQLADIAQTQRDAAHGGDIDAIDRLLDQRLAIAEALAQVEAELASISEQLDRARSAGGPEVAILSKSKVLAGEIAAQDALTLSELGAIRDELASQIAATEKGRRAGVAYAEPSAPSTELRISA